MVLSGDRDMELSGVRYVLKGNLVVRDRASFKATDLFRIVAPVMLPFSPDVRYN